MWDQLSHCVCYYQCLGWFIIRTTILWCTLWHRTVQETSPGYTSLSEIKKWSDQNKDHFPLYIILEPKAKPGPLGEDSWTRNNGIFYGFACMNSWYTDVALENLLLLEQSIVRIFGDKIVTPDALRNQKQTVHENVMHNMPSVDDMKGRVFFILWVFDDIADYQLRRLYQHGTNGLRGRAMFSAYYFDERHDNQSETPFCELNQVLSPTLIVLQCTWIIRIRQMHESPGMRASSYAHELTLSWMCRMNAMRTTLKLAHKVKIQLCKC